MCWVILLVFLTSSSFFGGEVRVTPEQAKEIAPHARPVFTWLKAVKERDQKQLKTVFSERMRKLFDKEGWHKTMKTYQKVFKDLFGDYKLEDFAFEFAGEEDKGKVSILYKGTELPGLRVIKESTDWKVDER
ncbi:MAG: hypothetical protein ACREBG_21755 [Pyrinomonadaceae bacterium]